MFLRISYTNPASLIKCLKHIFETEDKCTIGFLKLFTCIPCLKQKPNETTILILQKLPLSGRLEPSTEPSQLHSAGRSASFQTVFPSVVRRHDVDLGNVSRRTRHDSRAGATPHGAAPGIRSAVFAASVDARDQASYFFAFQKKQLSGGQTSDGKFLVFNGAIR